MQDIEKLKLFYVGLLGLQVLEEADGWLLLNAGATNIALHKIGEAYSSNDNKPFKVESSTKLVFTIEDIYQLKEHLVSNGIDMQEIKSFPAYPFLICDGQDADGNMFQLKQKMISE